MAALDLFGRRWTLRILWELRAGPVGFRELQAECDAMSSSVLNTRLQELAQARLVRRRDGAVALTGLGEAALAALEPLLDWCWQWAAEFEAVRPLPPADHSCTMCELSYASLAPVQAIALVRNLPVRYRHAVAAVDEAALRRRPNESTWSALEYLCHVRDVFEVYRLRITLALAEADPELEPMRNRERAERQHYSEQDPVEVIEALEHNIADYLSVAAAIRPDQLTRSCSRLGERRDVTWLLRQAAHEGIHHLEDIVTAARGSEL